jgi:ribose-phosphate pyrophosphokinase
MFGETKLFAGTSNRSLAQRIADKMNLPLEDTEITRFSDGEIRVELKNNVRGSKAIIIQSTCAPTNDTIMEMILLADALRRSSVTEIVAVVPYYGYARADRRPGYSRVPISARVVADLIETVGVDHVITVDLHATQIQGFFHIPIDNISATQLFVADIYKQWMSENPIIVSPDVGGVARARTLAKHLDDMDLAIVDKRRPKANVSEVMNIIGDVRDKTCIIVDDMVDTAGTLCKAADALVNVAGARRVVAYATHGVLSGMATKNIGDSKLESLTITDTIPLPEHFICAKVRQLSIGNVLAETIVRVLNG